MSIVEQNKTNVRRYVDEGSNGRTIAAIAELSQQTI